VFATTGQPGKRPLSWSDNPSVSGLGCLQRGAIPRSPTSASKDNCAMRLIGGLNAAAYLATELRWHDMNLGRR